MPTLYDCLETAMRANLANRVRGRQAQAEFLEMVEQFEHHGYARSAAQAMATERMKKLAQRSAQARRHTVMAQLQAADRNFALVSTAADPAAAVMELIEGRQGGNVKGESVRYVRDGLRRQFMGAIAETLRAHGPDLAGRVRSVAGMRNIVRELHGQASGDAAAKRMADAIQKTQERARILFNAYGGDVGKLGDFGLPHAHDATKVRAAAFDAWADFIRPRLDWTRIKDHAGNAFGSGRAPGADRFLREIHEGITTRDWDSRNPSMSLVHGKALANQRADPRILHFTDADTWMEYNQHFGTGNPFQALIGHFDGLARDIALMRVFGPNPRAGLEHAIQVAQQQASLAKDARAERRIQSRAARARAMLGAVSGANSVPEAEAWANFLAGTRQLLTAAQLGGAALSAASDEWTMRMAAQAIGMNPNNLLSRQVSLLVSSATRKTAAQMGYVADTLANAGAAQARFLGDTWAPEITQRITDAVLRASGLSFWTDMNRIAWNMEMAGYLAGEAGKAWDRINPALRRSLENAGFKAQDWTDMTTSAALFTPPGSGAKFLAPQHFLETSSLPRHRAENLVMRWQAWIEQEMEYAVPGASIEGRAMFLGETRPGSFSGELLRSGVMYKSFGLSVFLNQMRRALDQPGKWSRALYVTKLMAGLTVFGALSLQLKQLAYGRDARPMNDPLFWGAAFLQGGGIGIFGDFLFSESNRVGGGLAETLAGPVAGLTADVLRAGVSNAKRVAEGRDPLIGRDVANLLARYTPGTSLWYTRQAVDRLVWDQLRLLLDPKAEEGFHQSERAKRQIFHNETWWQRGELIPERAPSLAPAWEGS